MLSDAVINKLIELGGNRWTKGSMDRIYFNPCMLDVRFEYYDTGNIKRCYHKDCLCSNHQGRHIKAAKSYVDVKTGQAISDNDHLLESLQDRLAEAMQADA